MRLDLPDAVRPLPLDDPDRAVAEFAGVIGDLRDVPAGAAADLEALAAEGVDAALREGAVLMAVVTPEGADPALLTGVALAVPPTWDLETADRVRDSVEETGGPDVRETVVVESAVGPAVVAQRVPGVEQAREGRPAVVQLQAFIPDPASGRMLLLTLASPSSRGWAAHQALFTRMVASARPSGDTEPVQRPRPAPVPPPDDDESFENHTFRL
ncbi:hypothetical protein V5P93_001643 [Actinokineospora auranticolor]|uniref:Uncharacterized protein n=1 Tax=Actinokineospora auranticolor TaxID=155976 RepID=A0A2S6GCX0_9PSEU|nr:hypothetical protein [Actinokineospora auranticolor]PPK62376.1 hypothetical protein CLV40_13518 [Actinokineospora auranticolor]